MNETAVESPTLEVPEEEPASTELEEHGAVSTQTQGGFFGPLPDAGGGFFRG